ncbi:MULTISPECIES: acyl-CoA dehydrogenase family protein [Rhodococcus]|uniref:Acyl-CoA dehydrogenase family protein n=1 Tax=Rhodococcus rhodochrous TaxID=1829 RepID=A0AAW4XIY0_RHORH|nr:MULTISPECIES: acyl-CoA dehydrogenase family protein [Rhodococcus]MCD2113558.1 acyl-CoA dehydrogenase family protein [Rhodococcus rhodochrous]QHG81703.1 acyl-CoA dehydrogenase [Rhodococcus rhodochrous]QOH58620.1 acyl-CoA dehydrogenase [Rhodococcus rhodochrous]WAL46283.1 acyl-CoA dehydrogenase family protein [Rhodococcus pyridinivorans]
MEEGKPTVTLESDARSDWRPRLSALLDDFRRRSRPETSRARFEAAIAWQSELVDHSLAAPGWPEEVGGMALSLEDQLDYYRAITDAGAPKHPCPLSFIVAPTIIVHGTAEQKKRFLEPLLRAEEFWCQGFSEPGAGSDLASLSTRAVRDGDVYRVTGSKIWTTMADHADWIFTLVRTGPSGRSTSGITYLLIPMNSPGIEVRPLRDAAGGHHFAQVFFDDVEVPVDNRVGEEGQGWSIMRTSLGHERATAFLADEFRYRSTVDKVFHLAVGHGYAHDPLIRQELATVETGVRQIAANSARALDAVLAGRDPGGVASVNRLVKAEFEQHMHRLALRLTGSAAVLGTRSEGVVEKGRWTYGYLMSRAATIGAGTSEIQRNTIAENVLGLPSHRGEGTRAPAVVPGRPLTPPPEDEANLREALRDILSARVDTVSLLVGVDSAGEHDAGLWSTLVEFGLPGLSSPEHLGGDGRSLRMLCAAVEEVAFHLGPVALVPTAIALEVLVAAGAEEDARRIIGGSPAAFVVPVGDRGWDTADLPVLRDGRLTGRVERVAGAPVAEVLVVLATDDATGEHVLLTLDRADASVTVQTSLDPTGTVGIVSFEDAAATVLVSGVDADAALESSFRVAELLVAADAVGVANRALAMAVDWAGQREQFGRPIGSYQAISHRCADMLVAAEGARGLVLAAADRSPQEPEEAAAVHLATAAALRSAVSNAEGCIQIHGGIGFTWEHPAHLLLRRAVADEARIARPEVLRDRAVGEVLARSSRAGGSTG